jgi:hypothetical protein
MRSSNSTTWTGRVGKVVNDLDPRTVRLRDPGAGLKRPVLVIVPVVAFLVLGAVAFGASGGASKKRPVDDGVVVVNVEHVEPTIRDTPKTKPMNFHDPLYVFCDETSHKVSAYPLADPPGVVVNLDGVPEPEADARNMVGKDSRIRAVRRRVTSTGIRYVIRLDTPIKRIRIIHEGAVIIILPVR